MKFDGPLFDLPGGTVRMAIGGQHHYEEIDAKTFSLQPNNGRQLVAPSYGDRTVRSAFAELSLPIVGDGNAFTGVQGLQLSASARYDDYSDFGDTTNPKFGLNWAALAGEVLHSAVAETGSVESSNTLLNAIHAAARNTILNNLHGMQTDTPTYEQWLSASRRPPSTPRSCAISMTI